MMRDYAKVAPQFWTGHTGRGLRGSPDMQIIAMYLVTCPSSSMTGIYYLPIPTISFETGIPAGRVRTALRHLEAEGVAMYDEEVSLVFVPNMARYQVGESLKAKDKRIPWIIKELNGWKAHRFAKLFWRAYEGPYCLGEFPWKPLGSPFEGPSETLRCQEQDQEQDQEQEQDPPLPPLGVTAKVDAFEYPEEFERFWVVTNKKGSKFTAHGQWKKFGKPPADKLIALWRRWQQTDEWKRGYEKQPQYWFSGRMHEQEPPLNGKASRTTTSVEEFQAKEKDEKERRRRSEEFSKHEAELIEAKLREAALL